MVDMSLLTRVLGFISPAAAALPEFKKIFDDMVATFKEDDQAELQQVYDRLVAENRERDDRLKEKLAAASQR